MSTISEIHQTIDRAEEFAKHASADGLKDLVAVLIWSLRESISTIHQINMSLKHNSKNGANDGE